MTDTHVYIAPTPANGNELGHLQRAGGVAAFIEAISYIIGFGVMLVHLRVRGYADAQDSAQASLAFLLDNQVAMYLWYMVLYLIAGAALVVLVLGLHERLRRESPALSQIAAAFGMLWSGLLMASGMIALIGQRAAVDLAATDRPAAVSLYASTSTVQDALGGGIELVGAIWILVLSVAAIRTRLMPLTLSALGIAVGVAGIWTLVPQVPDAASVFGLGFIVWFLSTGSILVRRPLS